MSKGAHELDIVIPVHNEAAGIGRVLSEICRELAERIRFRMIIVEDGSNDGTEIVLATLSSQLDLQLVTCRERRGYAAAVLSGIAHSTAAHIWCVDSDGQFRPSDFWSLWERRHDADVVTGWRVRRADAPHRRAMSATFALLFRHMTSTRLHDPSCPFVLMKRSVGSALHARLGSMPEAFWWEFIALASMAGYTIVETPVGHYPRSSGGSRVFRPLHIPGIALRNTRALIRLCRP